MVSRPKLFNEFRANACVLRANSRNNSKIFARVLANSRKTASICTRKTARTAVSLPAMAWQNLFVPSGRKAAGASKALPRRISRVFEYFSPNHVYANSRNSTRNRAISRVRVSSREIHALAYYLAQMQSTILVGIIPTLFGCFLGIPSLYVLSFFKMFFCYFYYYWSERERAPH